jgi:hypothetical protein
MTRFEPLGAANFDAFKALIEAAWRRPVSDAYYRWRYVDVPALSTLLAMDGERCVATVSWFERTYCVGAASITCLEPFDWFALPETRRTAVGLRLMKQLQKTGKPILGFGGSDTTQKMLPKLGFQPAGKGTLFVLPLTGAYLLRNAPLPPLARRMLSPAVTAAMSMRFKAPAPARGFEARRVPRIDESMAQITGPAEFAARPDPAYYDWLEKGAPTGATGQFIPMEVLHEGRRVAWGIGRVYRHSGLMHATLAELRLAQDAAAVADAAVRSMTRILVRTGADNVRAWVQLPILCEAYRRAGFRKTSAEAQAMIWSPQPMTPESADFSRIADAAFFPLQESGSTAQAPAPLRPRPGFSGAA